MAIAININIISIICIICTNTEHLNHTWHKFFHLLKITGQRGGGGTCDWSAAKVSFDMNN